MVEGSLSGWACGMLSFGSVLLAPPGACVWHVMEPDRVEQQILPVCCKEKAAAGGYGHRAFLTGEEISYSGGMWATFSFEEFRLRCIS